MVRRNQLLTAPPFAVGRSLKTFGQNLRTARIRRSLTMQEVAEKIGTGTRAIMDAERGKPSTGIAVYLALLWAYDLLEPFSELAAPTKDEHGLALAAGDERVRVRKGAGLNNDF
jgi:transcriptional regulator with XRE-family HTH domain